MYTVYVLRDNKGKLYKGVTNNLPRRLKEHRCGKTITTARMEDLRVIYQERHGEWKKARERECYLKSAAGRRFLKKQEDMPR